MGWRRLVCTQFEIRVPYMRIGRGTVRTASFPGTETERYTWSTTRSRVRGITIPRPASLGKI